MHYANFSRIKRWKNFQISSQVVWGTELNYPTVWCVTLPVLTSDGVGAWLFWQSSFWSTSSCSFVRGRYLWVIITSSSVEELEAKIHHYFSATFSWRTSKNTARRVGSGLVPKIRPRTSSSVLLRPNKNLRFNFFHNCLIAFCIIGAISTRIPKRSICCQCRVRVVK